MPDPKTMTDAQLAAEYRDADMDVAHGGYLLDVKRGVNQRCTKCRVYRELVRRAVAQFMATHKETSRA